MRKQLVRLMLLAAIALATSSCATEIDFESAEQEARFDALQEQSADLRSSDELLTPAELDCVEQETGEIAILEMITEIGPEGDDLRADFGNAIFACIDEISEHEGFVEQMRVNLSSGLGSTVELSTEETSCTVAYIAENSPDFGRTIMVGTDPADLDLLFATAEECFDETNLATLLGEAGTGPQAYGDSADLDTLHDDCVDGDERACDLLYLTASVGSDYELLAADCAGRGDGFNNCTPGLDYTADGANIDPNAPGLVILSDDCKAGDMVACDLLFSIAELGSEYESTGTTCGGRIVLALPDCRTRFPSE